MKIIGTSGVSVLLAAQVMMRHKPVVYLSDTNLSNHHSAVLRFKSDAISKFLNIPFKEVIISKAISYRGKLYNESSIGFQNMYSQKVTGKVINRSIGSMESDVRYVAPDNFFECLQIGLNIKLGCNLIDEAFNRDFNEPVLSYIKMPNMMKKVNEIGDIHIDIPEFKYSPVYTVNVKILDPEVSVYQTIYYPGSEMYYRASITKNNLIIEYIKRPSDEDITNDIKVILEEGFKIKSYTLDTFKFNELPVGKMSPIDDEIRCQFIYDLTTRYNIYSFGRNGIWRSIRLDQLFSDIHKIDRMISSNNYYRNLSR